MLPAFLHPYVRVHDINPNRKLSGSSHVTLFKKAYSFDTACNKLNLFCKTLLNLISASFPLVSLIYLCNSCLGKWSMLLGNPKGKQLDADTYCTILLIPHISHVNKLFKITYGMCVCMNKHRFKCYSAG